MKVVPQQEWRFGSLLPVKINHVGQEAQRAEGQYCNDYQMTPIGQLWNRGLYYLHLKINVYFFLFMLDSTNVEISSDGG